jgi:hypothetical protein
MSGTALMTFSPSSVNNSRNVVCVAGCCGPKFSVQWYSRWFGSLAVIGSYSASGIIYIAEPSRFGPFVPKTN